MYILIGCHDNKPIMWNPVAERILNPHMLIVGTSGAGKTQLTKTVIHQLLEHGIPTLVFDLQSEYKDLVAGKRHVVDFSSGQVRINPLDSMGMRPDVIAYEITNIIDKIFKQLGDIQKAILTEAILEAFRRKGYEVDKPAPRNITPPSMDDVRVVLEEFAEGKKSKMDAKAVKHLLARLWPIFQFKLFTGDTGLNISNILESGTLTVVDLNTLPARSENLSAITTIFIVNKLWNYLKGLGPIREPTLRLAIVLDEAHQYTFEDSPVEKILREGRKFGVSAILASQLFSDFSEAVIGNTALKVFLRMDTLKDRRAISQLLKIQQSDLELGKFEAIINLSGGITKAMIIPYFQYIQGNTCSSPQEIIQKQAVIEKRATTSLTVAEVPSKLTIRKPEISSQTVGGETKTASDLVRERCLLLTDVECAALVDSIIQLVDCPTTALKVDYTCMPDIERNLKARYGDEVADKTLLELRFILEEFAKSSDLELKSFIKNRIIENKELKYGLIKCDCYNKFIQYVKDNISKLSERDQVLVSLTRNYLKGCVYAYKTNYGYYEKVWKILDKIENLSGINVTPSELADLAVKVGVANKLKWITTSGYEHECIIPVEGINLAFINISNNKIIREIKEKIMRASQEAYEDWDIDTLFKIYDAYFYDGRYNKLQNKDHAIIYNYQLILNSLIDENGKLIFNELKDALSPIAAKLQEYLNNIETALHEAIQDLSERLPEIRVRELYTREEGVSCYRILQESKYVDVCLSMLPKSVYLPYSRPRILIATFINKQDACLTTYEDVVTILVSPREIIQCGDIADKLGEKVVKYLKEKLRAKVIQNP